MPSWESVPFIWRALRNKCNGSEQHAETISDPRLYPALTRALAILILEQCIINTCNPHLDGSRPCRAYLLCCDSSSIPFELPFEPVRPLQDIDVNAAGSQQCVCTGPDADPRDVI